MSLTRQYVVTAVVYNIVYSDEAVNQLRRLRAFDRTAILDQIETVLTVNPLVESKAKLKRLRQPAPTQYRMRVADYRIYFDVEQNEVRIIQILSKSDSIKYLDDSP